MVTKNMAENKKEIEICTTCGFPLSWKRNHIFIKNDIFSLIRMENNICETCGHQKDGSSIKLLQPLIRRVLDSGKRQGSLSKQKDISEIIYNMLLQYKGDTTIEMILKEVKQMIEQNDNQ